MNFMTVLHQLHLANFDPTKWDHESIAELIEDFDLVDELANDSHWLHITFVSVLADKPNLLYFNEVGTDISSFLSYLSSEFGWTVEDYGEAIKIEFPSLRVIVMLHREGINPTTRTRSCIAQVHVMTQNP